MKKVALLFGGPSEEHDVSLVSAKNILEVLQQTDLEVLPIGITHEKDWKLIDPQDLLKHSFETPIDLKNMGHEVKLLRQGEQVVLLSLQKDQVMNTVDVCFPICHGPFGEDGKLQSFLEEIQLPFVGSGSTACDISLDKEKTKNLIRSFNIPQVPYLKISEIETFENVKKNLSLPWFVKPANMGSSIGISKVSDENSYDEAVKLAFKYDDKVIIEQGIQGQEVECAVLEKDGKVLVSGTGEIRPNHEFYSYEAKYIDPNGAEYIYPANISTEATEQLKSYAKIAFEALGCRGFARADFFVTANGEIFFNEINTHPGFTSISMFPKLWENEGLNYKSLILQLLNEARY